jgi:hypothetical protein
MHCGKGEPSNRFFEMQILRVELTKLHEPVPVLDSQLAVLKFHHALGPELFQGAIDGGNGHAERLAQLIATERDWK